MQVLEMLPHFIITFVHITIILPITSEKNIKYGELSSSQYWIQFFQLAVFHSKAQILSLETNTVLFSSMQESSFIHNYTILL